MRKLMAVEFYRLFRDKIFWVIVLASSLLGWAFLLGKSGMTGSTSVGTAFGSVAFMMLLTPVLAAFYLGGDFQNRMLNGAISEGYSRFAAFISKTAVYFTGIIIMLTIFPVCYVLYATVQNGWGEPFTAATVSYLLEILFLFALMDMAMASLSLFLVFVFQDVGKTLGVSMLLYSGIIVFLNTMPAKIWRFVPLGQQRLIVQGSFDVDAVSGAVIISVIWLFILETGAFAAFSKRELK